MKKLYEVQMAVYVMAEDMGQAYFAAIDNSVEIPIEDCEIYEAGAVPKPWLDCIPYGSDNDKTCKEILEERPQ